MAKVKLRKGWIRRWVSAPVVFEEVWAEIRLTAHSDHTEQRHVWAYADRDGWHGYYMNADGKPDETGLMISWHRCHWGLSQAAESSKGECVTSHTDMRGVCDVTHSRAK